MSSHPNQSAATLFAAPDDFLGIMATEPPSLYITVEINGDVARETAQHFLECTDHAAQIAGSLISMLHAALKDPHGVARMRVAETDARHD